MPSVSVIMPVYNSSKYLENAVESVLNQTYPDFELILVDDGSTDDSGTVCDVFAKKDARVKVIHKKNGGLCSARNAGLDAASGTYIGFIDNDDEYDKDALFQAVSVMKQEKVDWVRFSRKRRIIYEDGTEKTDSNGVSGIADDGKCVVIRSDALKSEYCRIKQAGALYGIWNALFKRSIIDENKIRFDTEVRFGGEDWLFNIKYYSHVDSMAFLGKDLYIYNRRAAHSTSVKYDFNRIEAILKVVKSESEIIKNLQLRNYCKAVNLFLLTINCCECAKIMMHPKCSLSLREKVRILKDIKKEMMVRGENGFAVIKNFPSLSKNKRVLAILLYLKMYPLFLLLFKIKNILKKEI